MRTFSVKNFDRFQHYKDRAPPWIKLYNELLDDYEFGTLPDATKFHLVAIWLLASRSENKIPYDAKWVARRINANDAVDLDMLARRGFIVVDQELQSAEQDASRPQAECLSREETEEERETEEEKKETRVPALSDWPVDYKDQFWKMYPHKVGKPDALAVLERIKKKGVSWNDLIRGLISYIRDKPHDRAWCNPATWLRQGRWEDQPANVSKDNGNAISTNRSDPVAGRATAREAQHVAQMGGAALRYLQESKAARQVGDLAGGAGTAEIFDFGPRAENAR